MCSRDASRNAARFRGLSSSPCCASSSCSAILQWSLCLCSGRPSPSQREYALFWISSSRVAAGGALPRLAALDVARRVGFPRVSAADEAFDRLSSAVLPFALRRAGFFMSVSLKDLNQLGWSKFRTKEEPNAKIGLFDLKISLGSDMAGAGGRGGEPAAAASRGSASAIDADGIRAPMRQGSGRCRAGPRRSAHVRRPSA